MMYLVSGPLAAKLFSSFAFLLSRFLVEDGGHASPGAGEAVVEVDVVAAEERRRPG
jgi:hypothetical protein